MWDLGNSNAKVLDYSNSATNGSVEACPVEEFDPDMVRKSQVALFAVMCSLGSAGHYPAQSLCLDENGS